MKSSKFALVLVALETMYLWDNVGCSGFSFEKLIKKFEWTESFEEPVEIPNLKYNFPSRSFDRSAIKFQESFEEDTPPVRNLKIPKYDYAYLITKSETSSNSESLTPRLQTELMQMVLDYLEANELLSFLDSLPELSELIESVISNRIAGTFPKLNTDKMFLKIDCPIYSEFDDTFVMLKEIHQRVEISGPQIDALIPAAKLLNCMYPLLDLKVITDMKDLSALLAISWIISNDSNSVNIFKSFKVIEFILTFSDHLSILKNIWSGRNRMIYSVNRREIFEQFIDDIFKNNCKMVIEILFDTNCIKDLTILGLQSDNDWQLLMNYTSEKRFKSMFDKYKIENIVSKELIRHRIICILEITDNATLLKTYISHEISEISQDFMRRLIESIFGLHLVNIFEEIIVNPLTLPYLTANPQLLLLPEGYSLQSISQENVFIEKYMSTPFLVLNPNINNYISISILHQNFDFFNLLLSLSLSDDLHLHSLILPSQQLSQIIHSLNSLTVPFPFIKTFWSSHLVHSAFSDLSFEERTAILTEILESRDYCHILAISTSQYDFYVSQEQKDHLTELISSFDIFDDSDESISGNQYFYKCYINSDNFILRPELHAHYIFKAFEVGSLTILKYLFRSENTEIPFTDIREIIENLNPMDINYSPESDVLKYFWSNRKVQEYFINERELFNNTIRDTIKGNHLNHISVMLEMEMTSFNYFNLIFFDIIDYYLNVCDNIDGVASIWYGVGDSEHSKLKYKLPELYEKYKDNLSFIIRLKGVIMSRQDHCSSSGFD